MRLILVCVANCLWVAGVCAAESKSPLADVVKRQDRAATRALVEQKADVNAAQADGMTALHWGVYHDDLEMVRLLIGAGADVKAENRYGVRPLSIACTNGSAEIVGLLLDAGADPNAALRGGETPLMTAARTGKLGPVRALLARGANVNAKDRKGQTAIMWAAADGHANVAETLIEAGAEFRTPLASGFTPFFFAVREGRIEVVRRLLKAGIDVNEGMRPEKGVGSGPRSGTSPLILAVENGHFELAAVLLDAGADPNGKQVGYTALHAITWVRKPIRGDGDPPPIGSGNLTSLELVRKLVACGADVNARHTNRKSAAKGLDRTDATPFLLAAETADIPLMKLLLERGADPSLTNADQSTALLAASGVGVLGDGDDAAATEEEVIEVVRMLLDLGADINAVDRNGNSAMHGAAYASWDKLVRFLSDRGASVRVWNQKSKRGWTPLMIAQGHRPGNFRPSSSTIAAIEQALRAAGIQPPY
jgi:ankyrin repeat protein